MHRFTYMRKKLETEYLAKSLRGHLTYFVTNYHKMHDGDEGRVALRLDGAELIKSNYFERMAAQWHHYYDNASDSDGGTVKWDEATLKTLHDGEFFPIDFYRAFAEFDSQSIEQSRSSENALVRMFALLDRRTGKRTLEKLRPVMACEPQWLQLVYFIRLEAEHLPLLPDVQSQEQSV